MRARRFAWLTLLLALPAGATNYIPASDASVVTTLPASKNPAVRQLQQLRRQQASKPGSVAASIELARNYIASARLLADPRYLGHAEALLRPWLQRADVPADVWMLYGMIQQSQHHFEPALQSLRKALALQPSNAQAWLTLASVLQVRGDFVAARSACSRLVTLLGPAEAGDCIAGIDALTGRAHEAIGLWRQRLASGRVEDWAQPWLLGQLAEASQRLGRDEDAEQWFQRALNGNPDTYLKAAYADLLLQRGQPDKVLILLAGDEQIDPLLLRIAEARQALRQPQAQEAIRQLQQRFDAARARNDATHQREEARFQLHLQGNPARALQLAQANWQIQKEPADARILLECALAARQPAAAHAVLRWLGGTGLEDEASWQLARKIQALLT